MSLDVLTCIHTYIAVLIREGAVSRAVVIFFRVTFDKAKFM